MVMQQSAEAQAAVEVVPDEEVRKVTHLGCGHSFVLDDSIHTWTQPYKRVTVRFATCPSCGGKLKVGEEAKVVEARPRHSSDNVVPFPTYDDTLTSMPAPEPVRWKRSVVVAMSRQRRAAMKSVGSHRRSAIKRQRRNERKHARRRGHLHTAFYAGVLYDVNPATGEFLSPVFAAPGTVLYKPPATALAWKPMMKSVRRHEVEEVPPRQDWVTDSLLRMVGR